MRLAILSDVHANLEALRATLVDIAALRADRILCLGDIVGYHADPAACIALLRDAGVSCIAGNHDWAVAGRISTEDFSPMAARAVAWTRERLSERDLHFLAALPAEADLDEGVVAVHGALLPSGGCVTTRLDTEARQRESMAALAAHPSGARICAFGHTHQLGIHELAGGVLRRLPVEAPVSLRGDALYLLNPGTVGQPRLGERLPSWLLLDLERRCAMARRVDCDMAAAFAKSREAGLMPPPTGLGRLRSVAGAGLRRLGLLGTARRLLAATGRRV